MERNVVSRVWWLRSSFRTRRPWQFGLRPEAALAILGVVVDAGLDEMNRTGADTAGLVSRSAFDSHPTLKLWLENPVPEAAF